MFSKIALRPWLAAAVGLICCGAILNGPQQALAGGHHCRAGSRPDVSYNYYVSPYRYGGEAAGLYPSPLPTPPLVGHTHITYEPLMPHEFLYRHKRVYHRLYDYRGGFGLTRTVVRWR